jgi:hypothetical protein
MKRLLSVLLFIALTPAWATFGSSPIQTVNVSNTGTCISTNANCLLPVGSTGAGHLLVAGFVSASAYPSAVSGGGTWQLGCEGTNGTQYLSIWYVQSSISGATTVAATLPSGDARAGTFWEISYTGSFVWPDTCPTPLGGTFTGTTQAGQAFTLAGANDALFQFWGSATGTPLVSSINESYTLAATTSRTGAYLLNSTVGTAPAWTTGSASGAAYIIGGIAMREITSLISLDNCAVTANGTNYDSQTASITSYTVASGDTAMLVFPSLVAGTGFSISSVSWKGSTSGWTSLNHENDSSHAVETDIWGLASPASGTGTVTVTLNAAPENATYWGFAVCSIKGSATSSWNYGATGNEGTNVTSSPALAVTVASSGDWLFDVCAYNNGYPWTPGSSQVDSLPINAGATTSGICGVSYIPGAFAGSTGMSWSGTLGNVAHSMVGIKQSTGASAHGGGYLILQ